jgi:hypothetical protein
VKHVGPGRGGDQQHAASNADAIVRAQRGGKGMTWNWTVCITSKPCKSNAVLVSFCWEGGFMKKGLSAGVGAWSDDVVAASPAFRL